MNFIKVTSCNIKIKKQMSENDILIFKLNIILI